MTSGEKSSEITLQDGFAEKTSRNMLALRGTRLLWIAVTLLTLGLVLAGIPLRLEGLLEAVDERSLLELNFSEEGYGRYLIGLDLLVIFTHVIIAGLLFWRRSDDWMALLLAFALVANGALLPLSLTYSFVGLEPTLQVAVDTVTAIGLLASVSLLYLFPTGFFVPYWSRWITFLWGIMIPIAIFFPTSPFSFTGWPILIQVLVLLAFTGIGVYAQSYRYKNVSNPVERQQTKWGIFGLSAAVVGPFAYFLPFVILPSLSGPEIPNILYQRVGASFFAYSLFFRLSGSAIFSFLLLLFPISFTIAIFRYRLWDIDVIINRAIVYGALTGILIFIFFIGVTIFENLFRTITGEASQFAVVASTLAIAALFNPLRQRFQAGIDRRFYRQKYDAAKALMAFGTSMRDEVNLEDLSEALLSTVEETMRPRTVSLWLSNAHDRKK